jgi:poly-gamma-glutamate capsule biosynthesis protein CapA/YwtB (metallophosphatase superfamily)
MIRLLSVWLLLVVSTSGYAQDTTRVSLLFLGDIMQHDSQIQAAYRAASKSYDYRPCFQFIKPYLQEADLTIGNLELTLAGPPYKGYPQFSAPDNLAITLRDAGVDVLVTANNHSVDRGRKGIERTLEVLDTLGIPHTGTFRDTIERMNEYPLLLHKNGFRIALMNYTYGTNGIPVPSPVIVNPIDTALIRKDIARAKSMSPDVMIVFFHWGLEYQSQPSVIQKRLAEFCFRQGVQLVIGSHPHVLQPMQWRKENNQLVVYSLGNFVSGQRDRYKNGGAMMRVELMKTGNDSVHNTSVTDASYVLEWVYRTADVKREYFILPVSSFERDTLGVIQDVTSKALFTQFVADARKLFSTYNQSVAEWTVIPDDSVVTYQVLINETPSGETDLSWIDPVARFYGIEKSTAQEGRVQWFAGNFRTRDEAERLRSKLSRYSGSRVVKFVNGVTAE